MLLKNISSPLTPNPFTKTDITTIGGGISSVSTALRIQTILEPGSVTVASERIFGIDSCTVKVTQVHAAGVEYIGDLESAKACIRGGIGFLCSFGKEGWSKMVELGILEKKGTTFTFTEETLSQGAPTPQTVRANLPILEAYYQELKSILYADFHLPDRLFLSISPETANPFAPIVVESIQPGISIMRLGALLQQNMEAAGISFLKENVHTIEQDGDLWVINGKLRADVVFNATNGAVLGINSQLRRQISEPAGIEDTPMIYNRRFQCYVKISAEHAAKLWDKFQSPWYHLCTANLHDGKKFLGIMVDQMSFLPDGSGMLVLYGAGPNRSWGQSHIPLESKDGVQLSSENETVIAHQIIQAICDQFKELDPAALELVFLHRGYNLNQASAGDRSDQRHYLHPTLVNDWPFAAWMAGLKFTHTPETSKDSVTLFLQTALKKGILDQPWFDYFMEQNQAYTVPMPMVSPEKLTDLALKFSELAGLPPEFAKYMSAQKNQNLPAPRTH